MSETPKRPTGSVSPFPRERFATFCENLKILTKDFGLVPFSLLGTQKYILDEICEGLNKGITTFVILKARQLGSSTFFMALNLFWGFEYKGLSGAIVTHTEALRDQFRHTLEIYRQTLPANFKFTKRASNRNMMILSNGTSFQYLVAGTKITSKTGLGTGGAFNYLHASEVSRYGAEDELKNLQAALSTHYPHRLQIYESTAMGFNHFETMCRSAMSSPTQKFIFVGWWRNELYRFEKDTMEFKAHIGETCSLSALELTRVKQVLAEYQFEIEEEQLAWYRWKLNDQYSGDQTKMDEDFPWTTEDSFVSTGSQFFTGNALTDQFRRAKPTPCMLMTYRLTNNWEETQCVPFNDDRASLRIWEEMQPTGHYIVGCDPAYGSSERSDRTAICVLRAYADRCVQVAEYCSNSVSTYQCAWILAHLCGYYRNVNLILEMNGPGGPVYQELQRLRDATRSIFTAEQPGLRNCMAGIKHYLWRRPDSLSGNLALQWKSYRDQKVAMMNTFKDSIELDRCHMLSMRALEEMKSIVNKEGTIEAEADKKDDRVIAAAMANKFWYDYVGPRLKSQGLTYDTVQKMQENAPQANLQQVAIDYLRTQKITLQ